MNTDLIEAFKSTETVIDILKFETLDNGEVYIEFTDYFLGPKVVLFSLFYTVNYYFGFPIFIFQRDKYGVF